MRRLTFALFTVVLAGPAVGQGMQGPGGRAPLPDHWLTIDSLTQILGLSAEQRTKVSGPYTALNGVLKQAADQRAAMRGTMRRRDAGEMTPAEREAMRARMDSVRAELAPLQAEVDEWHAAIRGALTPEQQTKFDALPKPRVVPEMMRRR